MKAIDIVKGFYPYVTHVVDASISLNINVTKADISLSHKKDHSHCAVANACLRSKPVDGVIVSISTAYLIKGSKAIRYKVPEAVAREIVSFDRSAHFAPGEYVLNAPNSSQKLGIPAATGSNNRKGIGKSGGFHHVSHGVRTPLSVKR